MNMIIVIGRITDDPNISTTQSGKKLVRFRVASDREYQKNGVKADFFSAHAWDTQAEFISKYFTKGKPIYLYGELQNDVYTAKDGTKRYSDVINVRYAGFVPSDKTQGQGAYVPGQGGGYPSQGQTNTPKSTPNASEFEALNEDGFDEGGWFHAPF